MADDIVIGIKADESGARVAVDNLTGRVTNLANETAKASREAKNASESYGEFFTKLERESLKAVGYFYALKKVWDFAEIGAGIREQKTYLDGFAKSYGTTADIVIDKTKQIAEGQLGIEQSIKLASTAIARGLSPEQFYKIVDAGIKLKNVLGIDAREAVDSLVEGVTKANERALRTAGIYADLNLALHNYADANNKNVESLSIAEQQQIALNAVLQKTQEIMMQTGGTITSTADRMAVFNAQVNDIITTVKVAASYVAQGVLGLFNALAYGITKEVEYVLTGVEKLAGAAESIGIKQAGNIRVWARDNAEAARLSADDLKKKWFEAVDFQDKTITRTASKYVSEFTTASEKVKQKIKTDAIDIEKDISNFLKGDIEAWSRERLETIRGLEQQKELLKYRYAGLDISYREHKITLEILELKKQQAEFEMIMTQNADEKYRKTLEMSNIEFEIEKEKLRYQAELSEKETKLEEERRRAQEEALRKTIERYDVEIAKIQEVFGILQGTNNLRGMGAAGEGLGIATAALQELMIAEQVYQKQMLMAQNIEERERASALKRLSIARGLWGTMGGMIMAIANTMDMSQEKMFYVNKLYSMGVATINTAEAITKALAAAPPPVNYGLAAAVAALGAAQIGLIAAQSYKSASVPSFGVSSAGATTPAVTPASGGYAGGGATNLPEGFGKVINVYIEGAVLGGSKEEVANELIGYIKRAEERSV